MPLVLKQEIFLKTAFLIFWKEQMARYFTLRRRPKMEWYESNALDSSSHEVFEPEPVDTGIIDADGFPIIRMMDQIGFVRDEDR